VRVDRNRSRMLGHVLRGPTDGPAYSSLVFAINTFQYPGRVTESEDRKVIFFID
jgi:hypothetical protein